MVAVQQQQGKEPAAGGGGFSTRRRSERLLRRAMTSSDGTSSSLSSSLKETTVIPSTRALSTKKRRTNASHNEDKKNDQDTPYTSITGKRNKMEKKKETTDASCSKTLGETVPDEKTETFKDCLPRTREKELILRHSPDVQVIGIDEAGRGPLAGPVVAAAAIIPTDIPGVMDSKKLTKEEDREELYDKIISSPNARWCIAIGDAGRIDEINILQATLECMRNATIGVLTVPEVNNSESIGRREMEASSKYSGCYIVCGINDEHGNPIDLKDVDRVREVTVGKYYALIDGNRCPKDMPCESESMVKGDSREYAIAAASILAKVARDRLMHEYDAMYPQYELKRHKGYPTSAHMASVRKFGASPIHRRTFAPLKHMSFDEEGRIVVKDGEPET